MTELEIAIKLRNEGKYEVSNEMLRNLVKTDPNDPALNYHVW